MDANHFDELTRHLTTIRPRRALPRIVVGGLLALGFGLSHRRDVLAAGVANDDAPCTLDSQCTSGICYQRGRCKKKGKLTGKCRYGCQDTINCAPFGKTCCSLGNEIKVCLVPVMGNCTKDADCCQSLCRDGRCCLPLGAPCSEAGNCCSNNCSSNFCVSDRWSPGLDTDSVTRGALYRSGSTRQRSVGGHPDASNVAAIRAPAPFNRIPPARAPIVAIAAAPTSGPAGEGAARSAAGRTVSCPVADTSCESVSASTVSVVAEVP